MSTRHTWDNGPALSQKPAAWKKYKEQGKRSSEV
jgi:hypothetical protein